MFVEDFKVTYDQFGSPKAFASKVKAMEGEEVAKTKTIRMNSPLIYKKYKVFQQSYGWAPEVEISDKDGQKVFSSPQKYQGDPKSQVFYTYTVGANTQIQASFSPLEVAQGGSPKLNIQAVENGQSTFNGQIEEGQKVKVGSYEFNFKKLKSYTGLSFVRNPGIPLIYFGFSILTLGTIVALYIHEKRVWAIMIPNGQKTKVRLGGISERNKVKFVSEFSELINLIRQKT